MASPCLKINWSVGVHDTNEYLSVCLWDIQTITSLNYRQQRLTGVFVEGCNDLVSITVPNCTTIEGHGNTDFLSAEPIQIGFCSSLETISFSALQSVRTGWWITDLPSLTSLQFPQLTTLDLRRPDNGTWRAEILDCSAIQSISFPSLTTITMGGFTPTNGNWFSAYSCPSLQTVSFPNLTIPNGLRLYFPNNALTQACVDSILAKAVANPAYVTGRIDLNGGTNATPSASGLADKATLIGRGVTVTTN